MTKRIRFTAKTRGKVWHKCDGKCAYCGKDLSRGTWTVDHIRPLVKGGNNKTPNLLAACETCNKAKGAMTIAQFRKWVKKHKPAWFPRHDGVFYHDKVKDVKADVTVKKRPGWWVQKVAELGRWLARLRKRSRRM